MKQIIQIRCKNNKKTLNIEIGSTLSEVFDKLNIDMPYGPISAKVNNKVAFTQDEMCKIIHILHIPHRDISKYFFAQKS